jgi:large subunit ribosomal protein L23
MDQQVYSVLLAPRITEKSTLVGEKNNQFVFKVAPDATKPQIKEAVEKLFKVKVKSVQVMNIKGKVKRFGQRLGKRSGWKKAFVSLHEGHDIDFMSGE